jgi:hypothetical protein
VSEQNDPGKIVRRGLALRSVSEFPGPARFFAELSKTCNSLAVDDPTVLDDGRDLLWTLEDGHVGDRVAIPDDDVS